MPYPDITTAKGKMSMAQLVSKSGLTEIPTPYSYLVLRGILEHHGSSGGLRVITEDWGSLVCLSQSPLTEPPEPLRGLMSGQGFSVQVPCVYLTRDEMSRVLWSLDNLTGEEVLDLQEPPEGWSLDNLGGV